MPNEYFVKEVNAYFKKYKKAFAKEKQSAYSLEFALHEKRLKESIYWIYDIIISHNIKKVLFLGDSTVMDWCLKELNILPQENINSTDFELREIFPIENNEYDLVVCTEVVEHLKDTQDARRDMFEYNGILNLINETYRILDKDGLFFITTPNVSGLKSICRLMFAKSPFMWKHHIREYSPYDLQYMLNRASFEIKKIDTVDIWNNSLARPVNLYEEFNLNWERNEKILSDFLQNNGFDSSLRGDNIFILSQKLFDKAETLDISDEINLLNYYVKHIEGAI